MFQTSVAGDTSEIAEDGRRDSSFFNGRGIQRESGRFAKLNERADTRFGSPPRASVYARCPLKPSRSSAEAFRWLNPPFRRSEVPFSRHAYQTPPAVRWPNARRRVGAGISPSWLPPIVSLGIGCGAR